MKSPEPKKIVAFRFSSKSIRKLGSIARKTKRTKTKVLEDAIQVHGAELLKAP